MIPNIVDWLLYDKAKFMGEVCLRCHVVMTNGERRASVGSPHNSFY